MRATAPDAFVADRYIIKRLMLEEGYRIFFANTAGQPTGSPILTATSHHVFSCSLEDSTGAVLLDISGPYFTFIPPRRFSLVDDSGAVVAGVVRAGREWVLRTGSGAEVLTARRRGTPHLLRDFLNFFWLGFVPLPFSFGLFRSGSRVGQLRRLPRPRHRYLLELVDDRDGELGRLFVLALAIMFAHLEQD